jgi:hypothetical protein
MIFRFANGDARRIQRLVSPCFGGYGIRNLATNGHNTRVASQVSANPAVGGRRAVASSENTAQSPSGLALIITRATGPGWVIVGMRSPGRSGRGEAASASSVGTPRLRPGGVADRTGSSTGEVGATLRRRREENSGISCGITMYQRFHFVLQHQHRRQDWSSIPHRCSMCDVGGTWVRAWELD